MFKFQHHKASPIADAVEAVNSLSYYGLPGTSDSRFRNLIAYTVATHPLLATCFVSRYDYYTRFRRLAGEREKSSLHFACRSTPKCH